jgi:acyl dehydratase
MGSLFLGVEVDGPDRPAIGAPAWPAPVTVAAARAAINVKIATTAAHVYSECARIWNLIHTDTAYAAAAGLPRILLHGTATLALAVSRVVATEVAEDPRRVRRIVGRFGAMVFMPSEISVRIQKRGNEYIRFDVRTADGGVAIRDGLIVLDARA